MKKQNAPAALPTISKATLARLLGISRQRVSALVGQGLPVESDGRLDREKALAWVSANVRADIGPYRGEGGVTLIAARTQKALIELELLKLELAKRQGDLVEAAEVIRGWSTLVMNAKTRLLGMGAILAPLVAHETNEIRCGELIDSEVRDALTELSAHGADGLG